MLHIALERFSRNADILGNLVHLDESPKGMGPETALDVVMRAVWGMLYADDACIVSRSPQLQKLCRFLSSILWSNRL